jgi:hypothetical protein
VTQGPFSLIATYEGAAGGNCVVLNGQSLTWVNNGIRYGAIV